MARGFAEGRARRETFRWCGAASEIFLTSGRLQRKQKANVLFTSETPRQARPSKTSDASSARTESTHQINVLVVLVGHGVRL